VAVQDRPSDQQGHEARVRADPSARRAAARETCERRGPLRCRLLRSPPKGPFSRAWAALDRNRPFRHAPPQAEQPARWPRTLGPSARTASRPAGAERVCGRGGRSSCGPSRGRYIERTQIYANGPQSVGTPSSVPIGIPIGTVAELSVRF